MFVGKISSFINFSQVASRRRRITFRVASVALSVLFGSMAWGELGTPWAVQGGRLGEHERSFGSH